MFVWVVVKIMVPFWVLINNAAPIIKGTQKGTLISTPTHGFVRASVLLNPTVLGLGFRV